MGFEGFQESNVATGTAGVSPAAIIQQNWLMQKIARANALVAGETPAVPVKRSSASRTDLQPRVVSRVIDYHLNIILEWRARDAVGLE